MTRPSNVGAALRLVCALGIILQGGSRAQTPADAAGVAPNVGQIVEFQDVVKATSWSRSRNGLYLSFGAPYPRQVLSVFVPEKVYRELPKNLGLLERTVRIKGLLEASPSGPMVNLISLQQFALLPIDESALAKLRLDGEIEREHFMAAEVQVFEREEFSTLEVLAEELRQSRERFSDGTWLMTAFFDALKLPIEATPEHYAATDQKINRWIAAYPASPVPVVAKAGYHVNLAWKWHETQPAGKLTSEALAGFKRELANARQILEANPSAKSCPEYFVKMEMVAKGQRWRREHFVGLFDEAVSREREYYGIYFQAARYYLHCGKEGDWERFAMQMRQRFGPGGAGDALYARIAWSMRSNYQRMPQGTAVSWEIMATGLEGLMKQYPASRSLKNAYPNFAWRAHDRVRLRAALPAIKANPDMALWVNLENLRLAEQFANGAPVTN